MEKTIIIARHGNTFEASQEPRRVGGKTDLPLVAHGRRQATALGKHLTAKNLIPKRVFSSRLARARETAALSIRAGNWNIPINAKMEFNEIDYGLDENKSEKQVIDRIGKGAIKMWDDYNIPPNGWRVNPAAIRRMWLKFLNEIENECVLVVTSNGIARFIPFLKSCGKLSTGAFGVMYKSRGGDFEIKEWNTKPRISR